MRTTIINTLLLFGLFLPSCDSRYPESNVEKPIKLGDPKVSQESINVKSNSYYKAPSKPPSDNPPLPSSSTKSVYVKGYYRKDGTYVAPHYRSAPKSKSK